MTLPLFGTVPLAADFAVAEFSCGRFALDDYLIRHAWHAQRANTARTFVALRGDRVVGYYSLAAASIEPDQAPPRVLQGAGRYPIPLTLLARLAVDQSEQGAGLGKALLKDAMKRFLVAHEQVASRALLVHAADDTARAFYQAYGFEPARFNPLHLYLLPKDMARALRSAQGSCGV
ncbi:MAG: GNAT family N-acetyltransferase [Rhodoferax sp.]|nr:GNAT family N-acetyltransferase [Rhodoferax sp.]